MGRISAEIGKTMEVSKNGIWWYYYVTPLRVAIAKENNSRFIIGYGYDLFHHKVIFYVGHNIIQYGWHGYMWPDFPEK